MTLPHSAAPALAATRPPSVAEPAGSVLIVDDERPLGSAIARELSARMQVELLARTRAARRCRRSAAATSTRCCAICACPILSGAEVYRQTRERSHRQAERFLFITGAGGAAGESEFLRHAGRPVLEKPFAMAELWRAVGAIVGASTS